MDFELKCTCIMSMIYIYIYMYVCMYLNNIYIDIHVYMYICSPCFVGKTTVWAKSRIPFTSRRSCNLEHPPTVRYPEMSLS